MKPRSLYLLNSPVLTDYGLWRLSGPIDPAQARRMAADGIHSAIGHQSSADLLSRLLQRPVPMARVQIHLKPGDRALVLRLKTRLDEGQSLDRQALERLGYELSLLERLE